MLAVFLAAGLFIIFRFDGTADSGDSVQHFLIAHYAFKHPNLFFDHWGKPFFVLLSAPFAQFGFTGMKFFNLLVAAGEVILVALCCRRLGYAHAAWAGLLFLCAPFSFELVFSGLTEHLFGLVLILSIYLALMGRLAWAVVLVSFLPFVRSEGLVIMGMWGLYLLAQRRWKFLPMLLAGHVVYAFAGAGVHGSLLWVFTRIPYARPNSTYGAGELGHFAEQLFYVIGPVLYGLLVLGILSLLSRRKATAEEWWLILGGFVAYFTAHTLFWRLGIFNSMGLKRVLVAVVPLIAILSLRGLNFVLSWAEGRKRIQRVLLLVMLAAALAFPFTKNKAAISWPGDFTLKTDQQLAKEVAAYIREAGIRRQGTTFFFSHPYLSISLGLDYFQPGLRRELDPAALPAFKPGDIAIWENWFAVVDKGVPLEVLQEKYGLEVLRRFERQGKKGKAVFVVLVKRAARD
ncbi:MAG: hypothetical protein H6558_00700 [Lewinellaceae bacterium]|nr:hypothetical protein [Lewinellaceae bacterium]